MVDTSENRLLEFLDLFPNEPKELELSDFDKVILLLKKIGYKIPKKDRISIAIHAILFLEEAGLITTFKNNEKLVIVKLYGQ